MTNEQTLPPVVRSLVNSYAVLVMAGEWALSPEENPNNLPENKIVPETRTILGVTYELRPLAELEIARRTIAAIG